MLAVWFPVSINQNFIIMVFFYIPTYFYKKQIYYQVSCNLIIVICGKELQKTCRFAFRDHSRFQSPSILNSEIRIDTIIIHVENLKVDTLNSRKVTNRAKDNQINLKKNRLITRMEKRVTYIQYNIHMCIYIQQC